MARIALRGRVPASRRALGLAIVDIALAVWFAYGSVHWVTTVGHDGTFMLDWRLYRGGAAAWLAGGDPWSSGIRNWHFAAPPPVLLLFGPFALLPEPVAVAFGWVVSVGSALLIVRRLRLAPLWLLFPPLVQGTVLGNPTIPGFALFVVAWEPIAFFLRPQLGFAALAQRHWRKIAIGLGLVAVTAPFLPWSTYLHDLPWVTRRYLAESTSDANLPGYGYVLALVCTALVALIDLDRAGWLAPATLTVPTGFHDLVSVLPIRSRLVGAVAAAPMVGIAGAVALVALAEAVARRLLPRAPRQIARLVAGDTGPDGRQPRHLPSPDTPRPPAG